MKGLRKKIAMVLLMIVMGVTPVFANMPVIDIAAIAQAVQGYIQSIQEWNAQIQQWKSEFDRIQKAAKGLSSGDFTQIVSSIASLTKQASSWKMGSTLLDNAYLDRALDATGDGSYSILSLMNNSNVLMSKFSTFVDLIQRNADKMTEAVDNAQNGLEGFAAVGSGTTDIVSSMVTMMTNLIKSGGNIAMDVGSIWNDMAAIFNVSPTEYAKIYEDILKDTLSSSTGNSNVKKSSDILKLIDEQNTVIAKAKSEQANINSAESPRAYNQAQLKIDTAEKLIADYKEMYEWATKMEDAIGEIKSKEDEYEANIKAKETVRKRTAAALQAQEGMEAFAEEYKAIADERQRLIEKDAEATLGLQRKIMMQSQNDSSSKPKGPEQLVQ